MASGDRESDDIFGEPVWFIRSNARGLFDCNPSVLQQLESVDKQLVVIAITGLYRTGKSYLMNRLAGRNNGFPLGATIESKTKGIWIWCRNHPHRSDQVIVLLDTEGLGDIRKVGGRDSDVKMMTLALLLSSCFVYNIMNAFNGDALEKLNYVGEVASKISSTHFPMFVLAVRDFNLDLGDEDGRPITPNQYLENCLQDKHDETNVEMNKTRQYTRENFKQRSCFVFDRPCDNRHHFKKLELLEDSELNADFRRQSEEFVTCIHTEATVKRQDNVVVDGQVFCTLVQKCVVDINNGCIPCMDDMFTTLVTNRNKEALDAALQVYRDDMKSKLAQDRTKRGLTKLHEHCLANAVEVRAKLLGPFQALEDYADKFEISVMETFEELKSEHEKRAMHTLNTLLTNMYEEVSKKIAEQRYHNEWGHHSYRKSMDDLKRNFYFCTKDYAGVRDAVFREFVASREGVDEMLKLNQQKVVDTQQEIHLEQREANKFAETTKALNAQMAEVQQETQRNSRQFERSKGSLVRQHQSSLRAIRSGFDRRLGEFQAEASGQFDERVRELNGRLDTQRRRLRGQTERQENEARRIRDEINRQKSRRDRN